MGRTPLVRPWLGYPTREDKLRTIVAGSRRITNPEVVWPLLDACPWTISTVVCGMGRGVDTLGRWWAECRDIPVDPYPADWTRFGKAAGPLRNQPMADNADALVLVWYGDSPGSQDMLVRAIFAGLWMCDHRLPKPPELR